jgi:uncharacterized damage-inducible protein DinB
MKRIAILVAVTFAVPAFAQGTAMSASTAGPGVAASRDIWQMNSTYVLRSAEQMPEADYSFKPVPSVRSFGQLIGHVAGSQNMFCAAALGETPKAEDDIEKSVTTKDGLIKALKASNEYCKRAYAQSDADVVAKVTLFGAENTRMFALALNAAHDGEHYGNIVTYMRIKGMVPPSSQPQPAGM